MAVGAENVVAETEIVVEEHGAFRDGLMTVGAPFFV